MKKKTFHLNQIITTNKDLQLLKEIIFPTLDNLGISSAKASKIPVRFGEPHEFDINSSAFYNAKEIVVLPKINCANTLGNIVHEYGHALPITGTLNYKKSNVLVEITAINFQKRYLKQFNKDHNVNLIQDFDSVRKLIKSPIYAIAELLSWIPLGYFIKSKYKL